MVSGDDDHHRHHYHHHLSLLLPFTMIIILFPTKTTSISAPMSPEENQQHQVNNIIDALIGSNDFDALTNVMSSSEFPFSATLFLPSDDSLFSPQTSPSIIPYHIVPQRLSFTELSLLKPLSRLPTLLPGKFILITNTSILNFTVDDTLISSPDAYLTSSIAVHGLATVLDPSRYSGSVAGASSGGDGSSGGSSGGTTNSSISPPGIFSPTMTGNVDIGGGGGGGSGGGGGRRSEAACLCREFPVLLSVVCGVLVIKIYHRYPLGH